MRMKNPFLLFLLMWCRENLMNDENKFVGRIEKLDLSKFINTTNFTDGDKQLFNRQENYSSPKSINI